MKHIMLLNCCQLLTCSFLIHTFIFLTAYPFAGSRAWYTLGKSPVHSRADIERQKSIHAHTYGQFRVTNLPACLWTVAGSRSTRREPTQTRGEHANSSQKGYRTQNPTDVGQADPDSNPRPSCCEATVLTNEPPCCPSSALLRHNNFDSLFCHGEEVSEAPPV